MIGLAPESLTVMRRLFSTWPKNPSVEAATGVILAAGLGRRMGSLTRSLPKPLLPLLNCPLIGWSMARMQGVGLREIVVNTHYHADAFEPLQAIAAGAGITLTLKREPVLSGPFGGVLACGSAVKRADDLVVFAGDGFYDADVRKLMSTHRRHCAELTIGIARAEDGSRYGVLDVSEDDLVHAMREKPKGVGRVETASCGVYVVSRRLLDKMKDIGTPADWVNVVNLSLNEGKRVACETIESWMDAGSPQDLLMLNRRLLIPDLLRLVAHKVDGFENASVWAQGDLGYIANGAIEGVVLIGANVDLGAHLTIENSVIGPQVKIGEHVEIRNSVVLPGATIPNCSVFINTIVE